MKFTRPFLFFLIAALLLSCGAEKPLSGPSGEAVLTAAHEEADAWALQTLNHLTLEKKIAQMICEQMRGDYAADDSPEYSYLVKLVREYGIGGFVLYGGTPHDVASLLNRLQKESEIPLLISSDFEGGPGQQIQGATEFPANMALSAIGSEDIAYQLGKAGAREGRAVGIHLTYSPVVDVQTQPDNPVLSVRSFGRNIDLLGEMAGAYIKGYQENGMLATAKHYPGRGDVRLIEGTDFTVNDKPAGRVEQEDFLAFKKAIEAGVTYVMSEHIAIPSVTDGSDLPASVEKKLATYWLREKLGFKGILTTDDMWYKKVTDRFGPVQACVMAVKAGHDAVLKPADVGATIEGLVNAVESGEISLEQIDTSVKKILYWKARLNLHQNRFVDERGIPAAVGILEHKALAHKIADSSLTLLKNDGLFPVDFGKVKKIVHISFQKKDVDNAPAVVAGKLVSAFPGLTTHYIRPYSADEVFDRTLQSVKEADLIIVSLFYQRLVYKDNGPLPQKERAFLTKMMRAIPTVIMSYGNPYHIQTLDGAAAFAVGYGEGGFYGNQTIYADSFIKLLKGEISPQGRLPIYISDKYPFGFGITY